MFTEQDILRVLDAHPIGQTGLYDPEPLPVDDELLRMVNLSAKWILFAKEGEKNTAKRSSYGLKHQVERWWQDLEGTPNYPYIKNSAFIIAALLTGWTLRLPKTVPFEYLNAFFKRGAYHYPGRDYRPSKGFGA